MDIPRIGFGTSYRPSQWTGRTADSADTSGSPDPTAETRTAENRTTATKAATPSEAKPAGGSRAPGQPLSEDEQKQVDKLKAIDTEVRQHEAAHQAAGGGLAGGASFTYTQGPDGRRYAVAGEVPVRSGGTSSPEAAIRQLEQVKRAALAPSDPSGQDVAVAAAATAAQAQAQQELNASRAAEAAGRSDGGAAPAPGGEGVRASGGDEPAPSRRGAQAGSADTASPDRSGFGLPESGGPGQDGAAQAGPVPALVARGVAAYGAAARINAAPSYASALFA